MSKDDRRILNSPVDVICYGTREHYETRADAIKTYFEAMNATEGSESVRYQEIYSALVSGSADIVTDGSSERIESKPSVEYALKDKDKIISLIKADKLSIQSRELYNIGKCKLVVEDRDIIKALLVQDGCYAAQLLRKYIENDKELIMCAARGGDEPRGALAYASEQLQDDKEFVLEMLKLDAADVRYVSERLSNDPEVIAAALDRVDGNFDIDSVKDALGTELLSDMVKVYLDKQKEQKLEVTAIFDFKKVPEKLMEEFFVNVFDTAEEMFDDLYLFDADYQELRNAINMLKRSDMHTEVVNHANVRYDGEKYYYSSEMDEFERVVLEGQKNSLEDKIAEAREVGRDKEVDGFINKAKDKDIDR